MIDLGLNKNATRMLTGFIMGTIVLSCIIWGDLALLCMLGVMLFAGSREYVKMLNHKGFYPSLKVIYFTEAILAAVVYFKRFDLVAITLTICAMVHLCGCFLKEDSHILPMLQQLYWEWYTADGSRFI